jgi:hypothetical protein
MTLGHDLCCGANGTTDERRPEGSAPHSSDNICGTALVLAFRQTFANCPLTTKGNTRKHAPWCVRLAPPESRGGAQADRL